MIAQNPLKMPEIIAKILFYLDINDLDNCTATNQFWKATVDVELHRRHRILVKKFWKKIQIYRETNIEGPFTEEQIQDIMGIGFRGGLTANNDRFFQKYVKADRKRIRGEPI